MGHIRGFEGQVPRIAADAWVDPTAVVIGNVTLGAGASVWPLAVLRGDIQRIVVGAGTNIQDGAILHVSHDSRFRPGGAPTILHERVTVGHQAVLHGCEVQELCLIGIGARVLDGAVLRPLVMLGAGALVPPGTVLEGGFLYVGTPARVLRPLTDQEREYLPYAADHYVALAHRHRASAGPATTPSPALPP